MSEPWPSSLQQLVNQDSFTETIGDTVIRSEMDTGPVKLRRRFTRSIDTISCSIDITSVEQYEDLNFFFKTTLNGGVTRFELAHPITGVLTDFRFMGPPKYSPMGGFNFKVDMQWEIMV